jgi:hypothetical protein
MDISRRIVRLRPVRLRDISIARTRAGSNVPRLLAADADPAARVSHLDTIAATGDAVRVRRKGIG